MELRPEIIILIVIAVVGVTYYMMQNTQQSVCPSCPVQRIYIRDAPSTPASRITGPTGVSAGSSVGSSAPVNQPAQPGSMITHPTHFHRTDEPNSPPSMPTNGSLTDFDRRAINDPLAPPRKRNPHEPSHMNPMLAPIYTRGPPSPYRKVGTLKAVSATDGSSDTLDTDAVYKFMHIYGSKINSSQFNYYVTSTDVNDNIKFELTQKNELFDGEYVTISTLDSQGYKITMDKNALPLLIGII